MTLLWATPPRGIRLDTPTTPGGGIPPDPAAPDEVMPGRILNGRFEIEAMIGEGGMGTVFRGIQIATGRKVAIKLLRSELSSDENLVARFRREGMVLCQLRNAHTVTLYDFEQTSDGVWYLAMELLEGRSLHQVVHAEGTLAWQRVFTILKAVCGSLAEAHGLGIIHRDLKPENIYLEPCFGDPEFVKVLDFGIAKKPSLGLSESPAAPLTALGQTVGTPVYMSPEQLGGASIDHRSDIYALGVIAYQLITGRTPYPDAQGPVQLISAQLQGLPPPPSQLTPDLPAAVDRVILRCLGEKCEVRYADVTALATALDEVIEGRAEAPPPSAPNPDEVAPPRPDARTQPLPQRRSSSAIFWVIGVIAVGGAAAIAVAVLN